MITKSNAALQLSVQALVDKCNASNIPLAFWTFTFKKVTDPELGAYLWRNFVRRLRYHYPDFCGVRVFELHPGGHGLHVHCLISGYYPKKAIEDILPKEFGFPYVEACKDTSSPVRLARYLSKYMSKLQKLRPEGLKGMRLWQNFGKWDEKVTCKKVVKRSMFGEFLINAFMACKWDNLTFQHYFGGDIYWEYLRALCWTLFRIDRLRGDDWAEMRKRMRFRFIRTALRVYQVRWSDEFQEVFDNHFGKGYFSEELDTLSKNQIKPCPKTLQPF